MFLKWRSRVVRNLTESDGRMNVKLPHRTRVMSRTQQESPQSSRKMPCIEVGKSIPIEHREHFKLGSLHVVLCFDVQS